jgi:hypothetical protein
MKSFFYAITMCLFLASCASQGKEASTSLEYQEVITIPGLAAEDLYEKSHRWIAETFKSAKAVIEYANKEEGQIIGNGVVDVSYSLYPYPTAFTLNLEAKDGKIRATFNNMRFTGKNEWMPWRQSYMKKFSAEAARLIDGLESYLTKPSDNW